MVADGRLSDVKVGRQPLLLVDELEAMIRPKRQARRFPEQSLKELAESDGPLVSEEPARRLSEQTHKEMASRDG
jgi:hypothetical protein